jgi:hypothetical protein
LKYNNGHGDVSTRKRPDSEYAHILDEGTIWCIDHILGVAFPTPIDFADKENGLYGSGIPYKEFPDYLDFQNHLEEITGGQEVSLESSVSLDTTKETNSIIRWVTRYAI